MKGKANITLKLGHGYPVEVLVTLDEGGLEVPGALDELGAQQVRLKCSLKKNTIQLSFKCPSEEKQYIGHWSTAGWGHMFI